MIQCEHGDVHYPHSPMKRCLKNAQYLIVFTKGHPITIPFHDLNVVCEEHLRELRKRKIKMEVYEIESYNEKVQFT